MKQADGNWKISNERTPTAGTRVPKHKLAQMAGMTAEQVSQRTGLSLRQARRILENVA